MSSRKSLPSPLGALSVASPPFAFSDYPCAFQHDSLGLWLYQTDCLAFMDALIARHPNGCFDLIFADPPYFLSNDGITCQNGKMVKVNKGQWDKSQGAAQNHQFNLDWLSRCQQLLKPNGSLWVSGTQHAIYSVGFGMQQLGMRILNNVTWEKPNPPPNLSCRFFTHATETLLWAAKTVKAKHRFNYYAMRDMNDGKQMKSLWKVGIPKKEEKQFGKHPTQKPVALLERILLASTETGDWVFDPFSGSATTGVAATLLERKFVGCELDDDAIAISVKRLRKAVDDATPDLAGRRR